MASSHARRAFEPSARSTSSVLFGALLGAGAAGLLHAQQQRRSCALAEAAPPKLHAAPDSHSMAVSSSGPYKDGIAYQAYGPQGPMSLSQMVSFLVQSRVDVVLVGEYHDDPVAHAVQLTMLDGLRAQLDGGGDQSQQPMRGETTSHGAVAAADASTEPGASSGTRKRTLVLSLEQFETDVQTVMDEYLAGLASEEDLMLDGRAWSNYASDYRPLVRLAQRHRLRVLCSNAPRRYVRMAGKGTDLSLLPPTAQALLPPLPITPPSAAYRLKIERMMAAAAAVPAQQQERMQAGTGAGVREGQGAAGRVEGDAESAWQGQGGEHINPGGGVNVSGGGDACSSGESGSGSTSGSSSNSVSGGSSSGSRSSGSSCVAAKDEQRGESKDCPYVGLSLGDNFFAAQNLWDAGMAFSIAQALRAQPAAGAADDTPPPRPLVLHVCGAAHCEHALGIPEHLARYAPEARVAIIVIKPSTSIACGSTRGSFGSAVRAVRERLERDPQALSRHHNADRPEFWVVTDGELARSFESSHPV